MAERKGWALVTGASGGIGEELARVLAREGWDLVLAARSAGRLEELAREFEAAGARVRAVAVDLAAPEGPSALVAALRESDIEPELLVNNAGYGLLGPFAEADPAETLSMISLNVFALVALTRALLPGMAARGRGAVLDVASTAAFMPGPGMAVYYATKAFVLSFSAGLAEELRGSGVRVTTLCPGPTKSGFQARAKMGDAKLFKAMAVMDSRRVAEAAYRGLRRGRRLVVPGLMNKLSAFLPRLLPRRLLAAAVARLQS